MNSTLSLKHRLHRMLLGPHLMERGATLLNIGLAALIILNVLAMMLETVDQLYHDWRIYFIAFEIFSVAVFLVEYLLRVWISELTPKYKQPYLGRLRYMLSPMALNDLVAILPSLLFMGGVDLRFLRAIRLFRLVRLLHLPRFNLAMHTIWQAARSKRAEFLIAGIIMLILLIICSSLVYFAEHEAQPQAFSSIPASLWWGIMTLTTVGYGDVYPITVMGKIIASFFAVLGIGFFALPSAILASAMIEQSRQKHLDRECPHCGKKLVE